MIETYYQHLANAAIATRPFWDIPSLRNTDVLGCFARPRELREARRQARRGGATRDVVGILGVVASSAADGSLYLLQHFHNASELFATARHLVLLVTVDKLVPTAAHAMLQARATALFGAEATLLDLAPLPSHAGSSATGHGAPIEALASAVATEEVHVILLDNGRHALRETAYRDLLSCVGCRACAVKCPTYREYAGPERWSPRDYLFFHLQGRHPSVDRCIGCNMCFAQCPVQIDIPAMMARSKARRRPGIDQRLLGNFETIARAALLAPTISNAALGSSVLRRLGEPVLGIKADRRSPRFAGQTFAAWFKGRKGRLARDRVAYYAGCSANYVEPAIGKATVALLEMAGLEVRFPRQVCCGTPQIGNGLIENARSHARRNIETLLAEGCDVVTACTSCALALKREYRHLLDIAGADELAARTYDAVEYVSRLRAEGQLPAPEQPQPLSVLYHAPCHLKARGDDLVQGRIALLAKLPDVSARLVDRGCCGMAGTFGSKRAEYNLSMAIGAPLFEAIREGHPDAVATDCPTCSLQIEQGTGMRPVHPVILLAKAHGLEGGDGRHT